MKYLTYVLAMFLTVGCEQAIARNWGGHVDIVLPPCHRLVTATWKLNDIWYLTEPMGKNEPRNTVFRESSTYGQLQGSVTFREKCDKEVE